MDARVARVNSGTKRLRPASDEATIREPVGARSRPAPGDDGPVTAPPGRVRLLEMIGQGGMGSVYRAEQLDLQRVVAFKQLLDGSTLVQRERFVREARLTARLDHPNIVPVHSLESSPAEGPDGYVMKLIEGKTLRELITETARLYESGQPLDAAHSLSTRIEQFLKVCDAVSFAHDRGIIHRDIKPPNIMVGRFGEVYLMDWGIARPMGSADAPTSSPAPVSSTPDLTTEGEVFGRVSYMSPEQAEGKNLELDGRSDQYALGLILFELVSLRRAREAGSTVQLYVSAARGHLAPLEHIAPRERVPRELRAIVARSTALAPADRYPSVAALAEDVRRWQRGEPTTALPDSALGALARWMSRHRRATLAAFASLLALAALLVIASRYRQATAELAARRHGERVTALFIDVADQAHRIDARFERLQEALEGLRFAAEWALAGPDPGSDRAPVLFDTDFADPARRPRDFGQPSRYRWPVSIDFPTVGISPGTDRQALLPKLRRLAPLREHLRSMIVTAAVGSDNALSLAEQRALVALRTSPIDYAYVDLEEGAHIIYPGNASLSPDYDVRTAGFYTMSAHRRGQRWGRPYIDSTTDTQGDDLVLPCTAGLWSPAGEFLGVAGVEITVTKLVETSLVLPGHTPLRTSLLDEAGRKVVDSGDAGKRFQASGKDEPLALFDFDIPEIVAAVRRREVGVREIRHQGRDKVVAFARLDVLGWTYVVELDTVSATTARPL